MATERKTILAAGLDATVSDPAKEVLHIDPTQTYDLIAAEVEKANAGGFDCTIIIVEPWEATASLVKLKAELQTQHYDGFSIGFAVGALKENTRVFKDVVNLAVMVSPETKFIFPLGREDIWAAIQRAFNGSHSPNDA